MEKFTNFEKKILQKLLNGSNSVLTVLRSQVAGCYVQKREHSGVGFFTEIVPPADAERAPVKTPSIRFGDVVADLETVKHEAGFLIFIDGGFLYALEGYTFDEPWPQHPRIQKLWYTSEPRDFSALK